MKTNPAVVEDKRTYHAAHAEEFGLPAFDASPSALLLDKHLAAVAGQAFDALPHEPNRPDVKAAYDALKRETAAQYAHLVKRGATFTRWTKPGQPYATSAEMAADVAANRHLAYFPSAGGFGSDDRFKDHPLMEQAPGHPPGVVYNDLFRAVHDWYAHAMHGHQFGPQGELRAWHEHARMFSPLARKALTTETHGQNSWVNFGPHNPQATAAPDRPFADQKASLLPEAAHPKVRLARSSWRGTSKGYWLDQRGEAHDVGALEHEAWMKRHNGLSAEEARKAGWLRVLVNPGDSVMSENPHQTPNSLQQEGLGLLAVRHKAESIQHSGPNGWKPIRLARSKKAPPDPAEAGFTSALWAQHKAHQQVVNDNARRGRPDVREGAPPRMDDNARLAFADWLEERGDPRSIIARGHTAGTPYDEPYQSVIHSANVDFSRALIHPGRVHDPATDTYHPGIVWRHKGTESLRHSAGRWLRHPVMFHAKVTPEQFFDFAATLPADARGHWHRWAAFHGWNPPKPEAPVKLARLPATRRGLGAATRESGTDNHAQRIALAKRILAEAGLAKATVRAVLAHTRAESVPAVAAAVFARTHPTHAKYAAAWIGLMTGSPSMTLFYPGEGDDALHVIDSPHPTEHVTNYLRRAGVHAFSTESKGGGTRAYVVNPTGDVPTLVRGLDASHSTFRGRADRIGAGPGAGTAAGAADARADYRSVIAAAEREAGV